MAKIYLLILLFVNISTLCAHEVQLAVASNFIEAMEEIKSTFQQKYPHELKISYASSGKLTNQIIHGAPFDLFFSADEYFPNLLEKKGLTAPHPSVTYAIGIMCLWIPSAMEPLHSLNWNKELLLAKIKILAIPNPKLAPYGKMATQVLKDHNLYQHFEGKMALAENVTQAYQFVSSGAASAGFFSCSQALKLKPNVIFNFDNAYQIKQNMVLLKKGSENTGAIALIEFLKTPTAKSIIKKHGYLTLEEK